MRDTLEQRDELEQIKHDVRGVISLLICAGAHDDTPEWLSPGLALCERQLTGITDRLERIVEHARKA